MVGTLENQRILTGSQRSAYEEKSFTEFAE
ncbi:hypothetical protein EV378_6794 [Pseudonocardia endophytica]|uniref:Uncharacterized protein n=1 Tax=Pseudonocardia endophytica TaxID=401976 RepID=A0A4R1HK66_PSEEN|nr:hypothetical protein EV378_6794 [Pseudonocardia endophytica]